MKNLVKSMEVYNITEKMVLIEKKIKGIYKNGVDKPKKHDIL